MSEEREENGRNQETPMPNSAQPQKHGARPIDNPTPEATAETPPEAELAAVSAPASQSSGTSHTTAAAPRPATSLTPSQRRGCIFTLLGSLLGSVGGALLTLTLLVLLNEGTLRFMADNGRLRREVEVLQRTQATLAAQVMTAEVQYGTVAAQANTAVQQLATLQPALTEVVALQATAQAEARRLETAVGEMATQMATLSARVDQTSATAERLQTFLTGLRSLLMQLESAPATPDAAATDPPTATAVAPVSATSTPPPGSPPPTTPPTSTAAPSPTLSPTRTPRPTATPIR